MLNLLTTLQQHPAPSSIYYLMSTLGAFEVKVIAPCLPSLNHIVLISSIPSNNLKRWT
jgi:hypothetical protein